MLSSKINHQIVGSLAMIGILAACQTGGLSLNSESVQSLVQKEFTASSQFKNPLPSRSQRYGPNRALAAGVAKNKSEYIYRNVASAFPDNGKKMMIQARSVPASSVSANPDSSPWLLRVLEDPENIRVNRERFSNANRGAYSIPLSESVARQVFATGKKKESIDADSMNFESNFDRNHDDVFESNDVISQANDLGGLEGRWLALAGGTKSSRMTEGIQWNPDLYKISVSSMRRQLTVDLRYQHYMGNLSLSLLDEKGHEIYGSDRAGDDEFLNLILDKGGIYFLKVDGTQLGNRYDIKYNLALTEKNDDFMEENDSLKAAYDLTSIQGRWLSETFGEGVAGDDDYFKIRVPQGRTRLKIDLRYNIAFGDIDLQLLNSRGQVMASSSSIGDDEYLDFDVASAGWYYLKIYPFGSLRLANMYDLQWSAEESSPKVLKLSGAGLEATLKK